MLEPAYEKVSSLGWLNSNQSWNFLQAQFLSRELCKSRVRRRRVLPGKRLRLLLKILEAKVNPQRRSVLDHQLARCGDLLGSLGLEDATQAVSLDAGVPRENF